MFGYFKKGKVKKGLLINKEDKKYTI